MKPHRTPEPSDDAGTEVTRRQIRQCRNGAIVLGVFFVLIGLPFAGNFGKGPPIIDPATWPPWVGILGTLGFFAGIGAVVLVVVGGVLEDSLPRGLRKKKRRER